MNDAVSTMLSGLAGPETFDGCIGFILGTGVNTCYLERKERITKHFGAGEKGSVPVNMETGGYDRFPQSAADEIYGKTVRTTFRNPFERMVSGKYQGGLFLTLLRMAAENALFSHAMQERLAELHELKAADLDVFLLQPQGEGVLARLCATEADREMVRGLIDALAQRTAKLTAISLTAVILHAGFGAKAGCPVKIVAEGSVFYRFRPYAEKLRAYMQAELDGVYHRSYTFAKVEHASLLGAGIAGLL